MADIEIFLMGEDGEVRTGIYRELADGPFVTLGVNHFENPEQWGAQNLTPTQARDIADSLVRYAEYAEHLMNQKCN